MASAMAHATRRLELPAPYDAARLFDFLRSRAIPGVESVEQRGDEWRYTRSLRLPAGPVLGEIRALEDSVQVTARGAHEGDLDDAVDALQQVLDLATSPAQVDAAMSDHAELRPLIAARPGLRVPRSADRPEVAFRALIGQQVSVAAASTTCGFIATQYGEPLPAALRTDDVERLWPVPDVLAAIDPSTLPMPQAKATAVTALAAALRDGDVDLNRTGAEARPQLTAIRGIGPWTAGYVSMRACGDSDVLLDGDLIVRRGAGLIGLPTEPKALRVAGERFTPWRSYLTMHLWQAYAAS